MKNFSLINLTICLFFITSNCSSFKKWKYLPEPNEQTIKIYIISHDWHTGIVIPNHKFNNKLLSLNEHFKNAKFYELGWGDKDFYQANEITTKITLKAVFWPTASVMHVVALSSEPRFSFPFSKRIELELSEKAYKLLIDNLTKTFKLNEKNELIKKTKGIYGYSYFFEANGYYFMTNTCNSWTAEMLDAAGIPIRTCFTLTADSVMSQVEKAVIKNKQNSTQKK